MEHHCGIIGAIGNNIGEYVINGLYKLQHRGYESAGISYNDNGLKLYKNLGLVNDVFNGFNIGITNSAIGHVRYSTIKKASPEIMLSEAQPFLSHDNFSICHNGNIPTINKIKKQFEINVDNSSDTFVIMKLLERMYQKYNNWPDTLKFIMNTIPGSYCFLVLTCDNIYALRDQYGIRPLIIGKNNLGHCFVSESCALENFKFLRNVNPGEIVSVNNKNVLEVVYQCEKITPSFCSFEYIYFMNHNSISNDIKIEKLRYEHGYQLGLKEQNILENSIVVPIPMSSLPGAYGFADATKIPFELYIQKKINIGRTFILPTKEKRSFACQNKFIFGDESKIINKNIYIIDDSIVRGTTMKYIVKSLKSAKSIHIRILSPPIKSPCYFGIDMSTKDELIAHNKTIEEIKNDLGVTSLKYIDIEAMTSIFKEPVCTSCFTGKYNSELLDW